MLFRVVSHFILNPKAIFNNSFKFGAHVCFKSTLTKMADAKGDFKGMCLADIVDVLENFAPPNIAEDWDNVGLLMDPMSISPIKTILLTNDLTEGIIEEAKSLNTGLIISYHPPIFRPLKSVTARTWKERLLVNCLRNNIAIYSPHTSWDIITGGVNDWLAKAFDVLSSEKITVTGCGRKIQLAAPVTIDAALHRIKKHIGIPHVQLALGVGKNMNSEITTVALCAGSGAMVLNGIKADMYLTGEMSHHDVLDAAQNGISVVLCNHSNSERGFLTEFAPHLQNTLLGQHVKVSVSTLDKDPLTVI